MRKVGEKGACRARRVVVGRRDPSVGCETWTWRVVPGSHGVVEMCGWQVVAAERRCGGQGVDVRSAARMQEVAR
jgi:hypothetical protein